jgi:integral membrane protein
MNFKNFSLVSILEGISFLLILFVSMPLKYYFDNPTPNKFIGMAHGILFVLYVFMAFSLKNEAKWTTKDFFIILICSVIPFGTFWMDRKYLKSKLS